MHLTAEQYGGHLCHSGLNVDNSSDILFLISNSTKNKISLDNFDSMFVHQNVYDCCFLRMSPSTSRDNLQATMNNDPSFSPIDTFYNNRRTIFAVFSRVSRKAFAFTTNTFAAILTWIAVTLIGYN